MAAPLSSAAAAAAVAAAGVVPSMGPQAAGADAPGAAEGEQDLTELIMEYQRREYALLSRMAQRQREMRRLRLQAAEAVHAYEDTQKDSLRGALVDPVINIEVAMLRQRLQEKDKEVARLKDEAQTAQFQPGSIQGQKLLRKCAHLQEENSELGRQLGEEKMQVLRIQMAAERKRRVQLRQRVADFDRQAEQVDAENERMQKKIAELGQTLKVTRAEIDQYKKDIEDFRSGGGTKRRREGKDKAERAAEKVGTVASPVPPGATVGGLPSPIVPAPAPVSVQESSVGEAAVPSKKSRKER